MKKSLWRLLGLLSVLALCATVLFSTSLISVAGEGEEMSETSEAGETTTTEADPSSYLTTIFDSDVSVLLHLGKGATVTCGELVDAMVAYSSNHSIARLYRVEVTLVSTNDTYVYPVLLGKLDSTEVWSYKYEPHSYAVGTESSTVYCAMDGAEFKLDAPRNLYLYAENDTDVSVTHIKVVADTSPKPTTTTTTKAASGVSVLYDADVNVDLLLAHGSTLNVLDVATGALRDDVKNKGLATYYKVTYTLTADQFCNIYPILIGDKNDLEVWAVKSAEKNSMVMSADTPTEIYGYYLGSDFGKDSESGAQIVPHNLYLYAEENGVNVHLSHLTIEAAHGNVALPTTAAQTYATRTTTTQTTATVKNGDANGDNSVDMKDVLLIRKYIANMGTTVDMVAADVNHDESVDMKDVLMIRKFIAGMRASLD